MILASISTSRFAKGVSIALFALALLRFIAPLHYDPKAVASRYPEAARVGYNFYQTGDWTNPFPPVDTGPTAHVAPAFPVLLATIYHIFGDGPRGKFAVDLLEAIALVLQVSLLPTLARSIGLPLSVGFIAEILAIACLKRDLWWEQSYVALLLVIVTIAAGQYLRALELSGTRLSAGALKVSSRAATAAAVVGALWGLLLLTGPSTAFVWAGWLAAGAIYSWRCGIRFAWLPVLVLPLLMLAPWTWRNYQALGHPVLFRSDLGLELSMSNGDCFGCFSKNHPSVSPEQARLVLALGEVNYNHMKLTQTLEWICHNQREFWRRTGMRFVGFWFHTEPIKEPKTGHFRNFFSSWILGAATILSVPGMLLMWKPNRKAAWFCLGFLVLFPLIYYITNCEPRYRHPITWVTCVVAAYPLDFAFRRLRRARLSFERLQGAESCASD